MSLPRKFLLLLVPLAAFAATTEVSMDRPVINFRLPWFTAEGHRESLVRGSEARFKNKEQIDIIGLTLTVFNGQADSRIDTMILSPSARVLPAALVVTGQESIRVINDQFEASGTNWRYQMLKDKKTSVLSINQNVRVTFRAEFKDILK